MVPVGIALEVYSLIVSPSVSPQRDGLPRTALSATSFARYCVPRCSLSVVPVDSNSVQVGKNRKSTVGLWEKEFPNFLRPGLPQRQLTGLVPDKVSNGKKEGLV
jgi:hypothetical protein